MAWTKTIAAIHRGTDGRLTIKMNFDNGAGWNVTEVFTSNSDGANLTWLKRNVAQKEVALDALDTFAASLSEGTFDATLPEPTPPTQAETDLAAWLVLYRRWERVKNAIDMGVLTGQETQVVELLNSVKAGFKPAYLQHM